MEISNKDDGPLDDLIKGIKAGVDKNLEESIWADKRVDELSYYYDSTTGTVLKGTFRDVWKSIAIKSLIDVVVNGKPYTQPFNPIKIEDPLDEESIIILYGPIIEIKEKDNEIS